MTLKKELKRLAEEIQFGKIKLEIKVQNGQIRLITVVETERQIQIDNLTYLD